MEPALTRDQLLAILSLGLLEPHPGAAGAALDVAHDLGADRAARVLFRHKVANIALGRLRSVDDPRAVGLTAALSELRASFNARYATAPGIVALLRRGAADAGVAVRPMKGMAVEDWYPAWAERDVGDLDVWVATSREGWELAEVLRRHGYVYAPEELPWFKSDTAGVRFGQMRLVEPDRATVSVDIHVGPYSVRYCGMLPIGLGIGPGTPSWQPLPDGDLFCTAVANAAGDCFLDGKTVNDLFLGLGRSIDPAEIAGPLTAAGLDGFLARALDEVDAAQVLAGSVRERWETLRALLPAAPEPLPLAERPDAVVRAGIVRDHTRAVARSQHGSDETAAEHLAGLAHQAYLRSTEPVLVAGDRRAPLPSSDPWTCVRLVPLEAAAALPAEDGARFEDDARFEDGARSENDGRASGELAGPGAGAAGTADVTVVGLPEGDLVRAGGDLFVPTVDYRLSGPLVAAGGQRIRITLPLSSSAASEAR